MLRRWDDIPDFMKCDEVKEYYEILNRRRIGLFFKRLFDVVLSMILLVVCMIPMLIIAVLIKVDSRGPVFYRQQRVTRYGLRFRIFKFRTMICDADKVGSLVTISGDQRVTRVGSFLRKYRLDELPQLIDILRGTMSFVGTRPEVEKYVNHYTNDMNATLLLPAGVTSEASIRYKNEAELLDKSMDVDKTYIEEVLPEKMKYNLESIRDFSFLKELKTMIRTIFAVLGKEYE